MSSRLAARTRSVLCKDNDFVAIPQVLSLKYALIAAFISLLAAGCSSRAWYEGLQQSQQRECLKNREECPDPVPYEEYKREREKQRESSGSTD